MLYRAMGRSGDQVSILGYGCMRFPKTKDGKFDEARTERQILQAIDQGVNYFDTAYAYQNGENERLLGKILAKGVRDRVRIATKLPPLLVHGRKDMDRILDTQLKRLQTERIDYYLLHAMKDAAGWERLQRLGMLEFLEAARREGKIGYFGFSYHGDRQSFMGLVDAYPWDFCQIQYNYLDVNHQAGQAGLEYAAAQGLGVMVMEPLRGGTLAAKMPEAVQAIWDRLETGRTPAEGALRWVWNHPGVTIVLSGMNQEAQIAENCRTASDSLPNALSGAELRLYDELRQTLTGLMKIGCTGCAYCLPCPAGVDIPLCFSYYNSRQLLRASSARSQYLMFTTGVSGSPPSYASLCQGCGKCEAACPQGLSIREHLKEVAAEMEPPFMKAIAWGVKHFLRLGRKANR
jgi:predicted aldo/keto reductase-like oxidoreductase